MNRTLTQIHEDDIEEIADLVSWYSSNSNATRASIIENVTTDVLASIEFDDPDRARSLDEATVRQVVRIVAIATESR